jgi:hypothetical protein
MTDPIDCDKPDCVMNKPASEVCPEDACKAPTPSECENPQCPVHVDDCEKPDCPVQE